MGPVDEEAKTQADVLERDMGEPSDRPLDIAARAAPRLLRKEWIAAFQPRAVEDRIVGDDQHDLIQQRLGHVVVDRLTTDSIVGDAGDPYDLVRKPEARILAT